MIWIWIGLIISALGGILYLVSDTFKTYLSFIGVYLAFVLVNVIFVVAYYYLIKFAVKGILKFKIFAKRIQYYWSIIFK